MLVVVTGGPGSGKTTLVDALGKLGFATVPEAAIQVIDELNDELGLEGQKAWRSENRADFQTRVIHRQVALEERCSAEGTTFLDRGRLDGLAYCRHFGQPVPAELERLAPLARYDRVFVLDTLSDFADRGATGRTSDRAASIAIRERIEEVYREHGYAAVRVPEMDVGRRVEFVLGALETHP